MHSRNDKFSLAIEGDDSVIMSIFITDGLSYFRSATFYDRSNRVNSIRQSEVMLGRSKFADREFRLAAERIVQNMTSPPPTDVTVRFMKNGGRCMNVMVIDRQSSRILTFDLAHVRGISQLESYAAQIIRAVECAHN
jgi:hypothetical protein